jgi:hypothetical protein
VKTVCGAPPGVSSVALPLPLFIRKPGVPLPGIVTVSIDPTWPVTNAGPLDVSIERPTNDGELNWTGISEAEPVSAAHADAWTPAPMSKTIAAAAMVLRMTLRSSESVLCMSVSFPEYEPGSPDDGRFICPGCRV